ncbi:MAG: hypothetical protein Q8K43_11115 [Sulfurimicrobium sp.]|nr:hypothetical protein [Sulfurimicrobium sp.]MDP2961538.1 hypothetical protein [Sulfurimicrobium sp.]MDZ7655199.1 hypothetical protein [Sulfurimicrobium sp.]
MSAHFGSRHTPMLEMAYDRDAVSTNMLTGRVGERGIKTHKISL